MSSIYSFPVTLSPIVAMQNGETQIGVPDRRAVVRDDTKDVLGIVSTKYGLLKHDAVVNGFHEALKNERYVESIKVAKNGAQMFATFSLPDRKHDIGNGDEVSLQFIVKNSYDGSNALQIMLGAFRLVCSNGMVIGRKFFNFSQRHIQGHALHPSEAVDTAKLAKKVDMLIAKFGETIPVIRDMSETVLYRPPQELFDHKAVKLPKYLLDIAAEEYGRRGGDVWAYYNALTFAVTHHMKRESPQAAIRYGSVAWSVAMRELNH